MSNVYYVRRDIVWWFSHVKKLLSYLTIWFLLVLLITVLTGFFDWQSIFSCSPNLRKCTLIIGFLPGVTMPKEQSFPRHKTSWLIGGLNPNLISISIMMSSNGTVGGWIRKRTWVKNEDYRNTVSSWGANYVRTSMFLNLWVTWSLPVL